MIDPGATFKLGALWLGPRSKFACMHAGSHSLPSPVSVPTPVETTVAKDVAPLPGPDQVQIVPAVATSAPIPVSTTPTQPEETTSPLVVGCTEAKTQALSTENTLSYHVPEPSKPPSPSPQVGKSGALCPKNCTHPVVVPRRLKGCTLWSQWGTKLRFVVSPDWPCMTADGFARHVGKYEKLIETLYVCVYEMYGPSHINMAAALCAYITQTLDWVVFVCLKDRQEYRPGTVISPEQRKKILDLNFTCVLRLMWVGVLQRFISERLKVDISCSALQPMLLAPYRPACFYFMAQQFDYACTVQTICSGASDLFVAGMRGPFAQLAANWIVYALDINNSFDMKGFLAMVFVPMIKSHAICNTHVVVRHSTKRPREDSEVV